MLEQLNSRLVDRYRCVLLLDAVLDAPMLADGLRSSNAVGIATALISGMQMRAIPRGDKRDHYRLSWHHYNPLLLGGLPLQIEITSERMPT
jgi:hypothetical protein